MAVKAAVAWAERGWTKLVSIAMGGAVGMFFGGVFLIPLVALVDVLGLTDVIDPASPWVWAWCGAMGGFVFGSHSGAKPEPQEQTSEAKGEPKEELLDPWSAVEMWKRGKFEYAQLIDLCEYQQGLGHADSAACLGWLYEYGDPAVSGSYDHGKAVGCYRTAALLGHDTALDRLLALEKLAAQHEVMTEEQKQERSAFIFKKVSQAIEQAKAEAEDPKEDK
ncbi:hypothetical protein LY622_12910 [Halomonas sp. M5N1S17]|uniref:hypothetical protein n=1 Tax=Halomonas alkalisoli TaxID=2907158 RepID=UPI001F3ED369|nr:hypothetical protein [Halomonas alkalisoli]MCE9664342.1 hypothetical protein [Halomonas alkalisoli]